MSKLGEYEEKLQAAKDALKTAGPIHARDLKRHINRMEKELLIYKRYQRQATRGRKDEKLSA